MGKLTYNVDIPFGATQKQVAAALHAEANLLDPPVAPPAPPPPPATPPPPPPPAGPTPPSAAFPTVAFFDDFSGSALGVDWEIENTDAFLAQDHIQYRPSQVSVANSWLTLKGRKIGSPLYLCGEVRNRTIKQSNGYWEARFRVLGGQPGWNAAWWAIGQIGGPLAWPQMGEIDFVELLTRGGNNGHAQHTMHWPSAPTDNPKSPVYNPQDDVGARWIAGIDQFHVYGFMLNGNDARWYVDGVERMRHTLSANARQTFTNNPQFIDICLYSGSTFSGQSPGDATMDIDWVRVWK